MARAKRGTTSQPPSDLRSSVAPVNPFPPRPPLPRSAKGNCEQRRIITEETAGEAGDAVHDRVDHAPRRLMTKGGHGFHETIVAELIPVASFSLGDAIGEQDDAVAGFERDGFLCVARGRRDAEDHATHAETSDGTVRADEDREVVARVAVVECAGIRVEDAVEERHEPIER